MKRVCFYFLFPLLVLAAGACRSKPKPNPAITSEVEEEFKQRWIAKRMGELQAGGTTDPREARRIAVEEFQKKYPYTSAAQKGDPVGGATP